MFLLYQESKKESNSRDSLYIKKLEALISFIQKDTPLQSLITEIGFSGIKLKILIDQLNELQEDNYSVFDFTKKMVNLNSVVIYSSSANDEIAEVFENNSNQKKLKFIPVFSGLNLEEYDIWIDNNLKELKSVNDQGEPKDLNERQYIRIVRNSIRYYTGAIPLYLKLLLELRQESMLGEIRFENLQEYLEELRKTQEISGMRNSIEKFYTEVLKYDNSNIYRKYACRCITNEALSSEASKFIFRRYFFANNTSSHDMVNSASCGFAIESLCEVIGVPVTLGLEAEFYLLKSIEHQVVLGHSLERYGRELIRVKGIPSCGIKGVEECYPVYQPNQIRLIGEDGQLVGAGISYDDINQHDINTKAEIYGEMYTKWYEVVKSFLEKFQRSNLNPEVEERTIYYKTVKSNFKAIDAMVVTRDKIVGINFTINNQHTDPYKKFLEILNEIPHIRESVRRIFFCWVVTDHCENTLFDLCFYYDRQENLHFEVTKEFFGEDVSNFRNLLAARDEKLIEELQIQAKVLKEGNVQAQIEDARFMASSRLHAPTTNEEMMTDEVVTAVVFPHTSLPQQEPETMPLASPENSATVTPSRKRPRTGK